MDPFITGSLISGIGSIAGGLLGGSAEGKAMGAASQSGASSNAIQLNALRQANAQMSPYLQSGQYATPLLSYLTTGINPYEWNDELQSEYDTLADKKNYLETEYNRLMGKGSSNYRKTRRWTQEANRIAGELARYNELEAQYRANDAISNYSMQENPAYQWQQQKGEDAINRAYAARGMYGSRPAVNSLSDFNQSLAGQEYNNQFNRLATMANYGMGAAANVGNYNINTGNTMSANTMNTGNTIANLLQSQGQTYGGTVANALGALGQGVANYGYSNTLDKLGTTIGGLNSGVNSGTSQQGSLGGAWDNPNLSVMGW